MTKAYWGLINGKFEEMCGEFGGRSPASNKQRGFQRLGAWKPQALGNLPVCYWETSRISSILGFSIK